MGDMTTNFSRHEFACKCGCGFDDIQGELVEHLQMMRDYIRMSYHETPLTIRSGCRCAEHNKRSKGKKRSAHLKGEAADIKCYDSRTRFLLIDAAIKCGITRIGVGKTFIHVDVSKTLDPRVAWLY